MSVILWTGDHSKTIAERLRLANTLAIDVLIDSNIYNALDLGRYPKSSAHPKYVVVPAHVLFLTVGGAFHLYGDVPKSWSAVASIPSVGTLEHTLKNAFDNSFGLNADGEAIVFKSHWAMRQALTAFAVKRVDLPNGDDNWALVADEEDRQKITQTTLRAFTNPNLLFLNDLKMEHLVVKGGLATWTLLLWLLQIKYSAPDEADHGDLCIVAQALRKAALECFSHLDHALPAAISSFLQLASSLPMGLLTDDSSLSDRLQYLKLVVDYSKPSNHLGLIQKNFATVMIHHPDVAKWVGDDADAYANFCELRRLLVPNVADSFDLLELLARQLRKYDELFVEGKVATNITTLAEMLHTDRGYTLKGDSTSSSHAESDVPKVSLTSQLSTFLTKLTQWNSHVDDTGKALDGVADILELVEICATAKYTPVRMWVLGLSKQSGLPASVFIGQLVGAPLQFDNFFLDTVTTGPDGEIEAGLRDLTVGHFSSDFLKNLKAGRLSQINWDKDFLVPILQLISTDTVSTMTLEQLLRDSDRFAYFKELVPKALWTIGLLPTAEYSLPSVLKHIMEPLRLAKTAGTGMHQDTAAAAAAFIRGAFQHAELRIQTAFRGKTESSTSFVDSSLRARTVFDDKVARLHDVARLMRDFKETVSSISPAKTPDKGTPKLRSAKRRLADLAGDDVEEPGSRRIVERGGDGDLFSFSAQGDTYSRKAIQAGLVEKGNKGGCELYAVANGPPHLKERWCRCGKNSWKHKTVLSSADQKKHCVIVETQKQSAPTASTADSGAVLARDAQGEPVLQDVTASGAATGDEQPLLDATNRSLVLFWKPGDGQYGGFSNWAPSPIQYTFGDDSFQFGCGEQLFAALKADAFGDREKFAEIKVAGRQPSDYKRMGRDVRGFDERVWTRRRESIMQSVVAAKFEQNPELGRLLDDTGRATIIEASPIDKVWGAGLSARHIRDDASELPGQNLLGKALMDVRRERRDAIRRQRQVRFAPLSEERQQEALQAVVDVRREAFRPPVLNLLEPFEADPAEYKVIVIGSGRPRPESMQSFIEQGGAACLALDKRPDCGGIDMSLASNAAAVRAMVERRIADGKGGATGLHVCQQCNTWAAALYLPQGDDPPLGPYRSERFPDGRPDLPAAPKKRCDEANKLLALSVELATLIHHGGGSVSFENGPSCADRASPQFVEIGRFNTAEHFSYYDMPPMKEFMRVSGSQLFTVARCSTTSHLPDNGYRKIYGLAANPKALARATDLLALSAVVCTHASHRRLRGTDENGVPHSRHAEEYTGPIAKGVAQMHLAGGPVDDSVQPPAQPPPDRPPTPPPPPPPDASPRRSQRRPTGGAASGPQGPAAGKASGRTSAIGKPARRVAETPTQSAGRKDSPACARKGKLVTAFLVAMVTSAANGPLILLNDGDLPLGDVPAGTTSAARSAATGLAASLLPAVAASWAALPPHYAALRKVASTTEHILAMFAASTPPGLPIVYDGSTTAGWALVPLSDIGQGDTRSRVMLALQLVADLYGDGRFGDPGEPVDGLIGVHDYAGVGTSQPPQKDGLRTFQRRQRRDVSHTNELRSALADEARKQAAQGDLDMANYLDENIALVKCAPTEDVGSGPRSAAHATPPWLMYQPFRDMTVEASAPLAAPIQQTASLGPPPTCKADLIDRAGLDLIEAWFEQNLQWMISLVSPDQPKADRPATLVIGQEHFHAHRRGIVWDCRREVEGIIVPLDFTANTGSNWNVEWLREQLQSYPCRETVSHLCDGADYKADLPLSFCFTPHLLSLADAGGLAYAGIYKDLQRLKQLGYYEWFAQIPFAPWGLNGMGTRPKPSDPITGELCFRRIVSGSDPYDEIAGGDGRVRPSVNAASRQPYPALHDNDTRRRWRSAGIAVLVVLLLAGNIRQMPSLWRGLARFRKERKPRALDVMHDLAIMGAIAKAASLPLFVFVDDFKEFFYQFRLASRCLWYCGFVVLDPETRQLWCIVELVMAMGFAPSSNIAQMGGEALLFILDMLMEAFDVVDPAEEAQLAAIMAERHKRHGGTNGRPRRRYIYTDDALIAVIGTQRFLRAIVQWRTLLRTANVLAAAMHKRQLGTHAIYLGVRLMSTLGYAAVPEVKLLKALHWMEQLRAGSLSKEEAKRCFGLLVHLVFLDATMRATTAGLWKATRRSRADPVTLTEAEDRRASRWQLRLRQAAAVQMDEAVRRSNRKAETAGGLTLIGQSDACRERKQELAALGGYSHGVVWRLILPQRAVEILPISADEFLAFLVHLLVNADAHARATRVIHALDNVNALLAIVNDSAHAPIMLAVYDIMMQMPAYLAVKHKLLAAQWFGDRLVMADAASRGYDDVLRSVASALRVNLVRAQPPEAAQELVSRVIDAQERLLLLEEPAVASAQPRQLRGTAEYTTWRQRARSQQEGRDYFEVAIDARGVLATLGTLGDDASTEQAYASFLDGLEPERAFASGRLDRAMQHVSAARVAAALSASALYVRAGGHFRLLGQSKLSAHADAQCQRVVRLAEVYLQRPALTLRMAKLAMARAGLKEVPKLSQHRHLSAVESFRGKARRNTSDGDGPPSAAGRFAGVEGGVGGLVALAAGSHSDAPLVVTSADAEQYPGQRLDETPAQWATRAEDVYRQILRLISSQTVVQNGRFRYPPELFTAQSPLLALAPFFRDDPCIRERRAKGALVAVLAKIVFAGALTSDDKARTTIPEDARPTIRTISRWNARVNQLRLASLRARQHVNQPGGFLVLDGGLQSRPDRPRSIPLPQGVRVFLGRNVTSLVQGPAQRSVTLNIECHSESRQLLSRHHVDVTWIGGGKALVEDTNTGNGTAIDGQLIPTLESRIMHTGSVLTLGVPHLIEGRSGSPPNEFVYRLCSGQDLTAALQRPLSNAERHVGGGEPSSTDKDGPTVPSAFHCAQCDDVGDPLGERIKDYFKCYGGNSQCERRCVCKDARDDGIFQCAACNRSYCVVHRFTTRHGCGLLQSGQTSARGESVCITVPPPAADETSFGQRKRARSVGRQRPLTPTERHIGGGEPSSTDKDGPRSWKLEDELDLPPPMPKRRRPTEGETEQLAAEPAQRRRRSAMPSTPPQKKLPKCREALPKSPSAVQDAVRGMEQDGSRHALSPRDKDLLARISDATTGFAEYGANQGTVKGETSAWDKYWTPYCQAMGTPVWRTTEATLYPQREGLLLIGFVIDTWQKMKPRRKADPAPKIQSALNVLTHVRRRHGRKGYDMPAPTMLKFVARGMAKEMLVNYGKHSLVPQRCEPFTAEMNHRMRTIPEGTLVNGRRYDPNVAHWIGWRLVDTFANQTGERKNNIAGHENGEYTRADVQYIIDGSSPNPDPSPEQLRSMGQHALDRVIVKGGPSKADPLNMHFGAAPRVFKFDRSNSSNFAAALVDYELAFPVRGRNRLTAPLFTADGNEKRWTASSIDKTLEGVMQVCLSEEERQHRTFHSKRVWLGSALKHLKFSVGEIQALVHWRSEDSVNIYGRMDEIYQMNAREKAASAAFTVMNASSLPRIDPVAYNDQNEIVLPDVVRIASQIMVDA